jgi:hypothetical protein
MQTGEGIGEQEPVVELARPASASSSTGSAGAPRSSGSFVAGSSVIADSLECAAPTKLSSEPVDTKQPSAGVRTVNFNGLVGVVSAELDTWRSVLRSLIHDRTAHGGRFDNDAARSGTISLTDDVVCRVRDAFEMSDHSLFVALLQVLRSVLHVGYDPGSNAQVELARSFRRLWRGTQSQGSGHRLGSQ